MRFSAKDARNSAFCLTVARERPPRTRETHWVLCCYTVLWFGWACDDEEGSCWVWQAALEANAGILACNMTSTDTSAALLEVVAALLKGRNAVVGGMEADHLPVG